MANMDSRIAIRNRRAGSAPRAEPAGPGRRALLHSGIVGHRPQRWAVLASWAAFLCTLPSVAWRVAMMAGVDLGFAEAELFRGSTGGWLYVLGLEVVQVGAGALCLGLCMRWGERIPQWVPALGGRVIHRLVPTLLGALGALALVALIISMLSQFVPSWLGYTDAWTPSRGMDAPQRVLVGLAYAPTLLWPIALVTALIGYWRRRSPER